MSRSFSEDAYKAAKEPKELMIIPNANHVDLYDRVDLIPFDKLESFFKESFKYSIIIITFIVTYFNLIRMR